MRATKPRIGLLLGDPSGIGPEIVAKLLAREDTSELARILVIGDRRIYEQGLAIASVADVQPEFHEYPNRGEFPLAQASAAAGAFALATLRLGVEMLQQKNVDALVYAPLNKQAMKLAGMKEEDELHYFASVLGHAGAVSEINVCDGLWTSRVTSHVPLASVPGLITEEKIESAVQLLYRALVDAGIAAPRIAVAGLNPHAGEGGLLGSEEITIIAPAVKKMRMGGFDVTGPLPADTLFVMAKRDGYNGIVTMYHDQGQIALKLLGFHRGVTVAGGLPVAIATPAHGTAFDIVGKGVADVGAMKAAFLIACEMAAA